MATRRTKPQGEEASPPAPTESGGEAEQADESVSVRPRSELRSHGNLRRSCGPRRRTGCGHSWGRSHESEKWTRDWDMDWGTPAANAASGRERWPDRGADRKRKSRPQGWPGAAGDRWGGAGPGSRARESGPIPDGARSAPVSGDGRRRAAPPVAACAARADILHGAPVNAPAAGLSHRRNPLSGGRLRPDSACGRWCVNTQAWVVIRSVEIRVRQQDARARAEKAQAGLVLRQVIVAAVLIAMAASAPRTSTGRSTRYFEIDWWA